MGEVRSPEPALLICAILAGREALLDEAVGLLTERVGAVDLTSDTFPFDLTDYYEQQMGPDLLRRFVTFERLIDPAELADIKRLTPSPARCLGRSTSIRARSTAANWCWPARNRMPTASTCATASTPR